MKSVRLCADRLSIGSSQNKPHLGIDLAVAGRHAIVRRALKNREVLGLQRDFRDRLHRRRPGANDADALASEIHARMRPAAGVIGFALEILEARKFRQVGDGQAADGGDEIFGGHRLASVGAHRPQVRRLVKDRFGDAGVKRDVSLQVEAGGAMLQIAQDFRLPLSLFFSLSLSLTLSLYFYVSLSLSNSPTSLSHFISLSLKFISLSTSMSLSLFLTDQLSLSHPLSLSFSLSHFISLLLCLNLSL